MLPRHMKDYLLIRWHLGLGDAIICNAIVRHYATQHELVCLPVKYHNVPSVQYMFKDLSNVVIRPVYGDEDMNFFADTVWKGPKLGLGMYGAGFYGSLFDRSFYSQAGLDFDLRWSGWKCEFDEKTAVEYCNYAGQPVYFVHDDPTRGFVIDKSKSDSLWAMAEHPKWICRPDPLYSPNLFAWTSWILRATEIHCINSSFALFIDSIDLPNNPPLYLHLYARSGGEVPTFKKNWIRLT